MKVYSEAYGCALNVGEAREVEDEYLSRGWGLASSPEDADLVIVFTCVVVEKTERRMMKRLLTLSRYPRLVVAGCLASSRRGEVMAAAPMAELVTPDVLDSFREAIPVIGPAVAPSERDACVTVPLATGCTGSCSYCITKEARGRLRSRAVGRVLDSVRDAVRTGPKEVQMAAQDTASYGLDIGTDLPSLVSAVCALPHDFRVRMGMMNPRSVLPNLERIADLYLEPKVFKFLHLPVQSGSDSVLKSMERGYSAGDFLKIVESARSRAPELSLSTDLIVGYPGETDDDHQANLDIIVKARPDIVNVTRFSPRPGTRAASMPGRVDGRIVKERSRRVSEVRFEVALRLNRDWIGREVKALATEHVKQGTTVLRTDQYRQVVVKELLELGAFHTVLVENATPTYLIGTRSV